MVIMEAAVMWILHLLQISLAQRSYNIINSAAVHRIGE